LGELGAKGGHDGVHAVLHPTILRKQKVPNISERVPIISPKKIGAFARQRLGAANPLRVWSISNVKKTHKRLPLGERRGVTGEWEVTRRSE